MASYQQHTGPVLVCCFCGAVLWLRGAYIYRGRYCFESAWAVVKCICVYVLQAMVSQCV